MPFATTLSIPRHRSRRRESPIRKPFLAGLTCFAAVALIVVLQVTVDNMAANAVGADTSAAIEALSVATQF